MTEKQKNVVAFMVQQAIKGKASGGKSDISHSKEDETDPSQTDKDGDETVKAVYESMSEKQKNVVAFMIGEAVNNATGSTKNKEEDNKMSHNAFEGNDSRELIHMDMRQMLQDGKRLGSFRESVMQHAEAHDMDIEEFIQHDDRYGIMAKPGDAKSLGIEALYPEYKSVGGETPEFIQRNMARQS